MMIKKLLAIIFLLISIPALAQSGVKISQMPTQPGNPPIPPTAQIPFISGGANFKGSLAPLSGSTGDIQTNNGSNGFSSFSLNTTSGTGSAANGVLMNNSGVTQALSIGTNYMGWTNQISPSSLAASALFQISQGLIVDPRNYGAVCDAQYADGRTYVPRSLGGVTLTSGSPVISIGGYTFKTQDIGKSIALNAGFTGTAGVGLGTIVSIGPGGANATLSVTPTVSNVGGGVAIFGHDDTAGFQAAAQVAKINGGYVIVPSNCAVREMVPPQQVSFIGQSVETDYNYNFTLPVLYVLATGFTEDSASYGINVTDAQGVGLRGFEIRGPISFPRPATASGFANEKLSCVGTDGGTDGPTTGGSLQDVVLENMGFQQCFVGFGSRINLAVQGGHIFFTSRNSEYSTLAWGMHGGFSDGVEINDTYTGNHQGYGDIYWGPGAGFGTTAMRLIGTRMEEGPGLYCDACQGNHLEGTEFQFEFTDNPGVGAAGVPITLNGQWDTFTMTGGFIEQHSGPAVKLTGSGNFGHPSASFVNVFADEVPFVNSSYSAGTQSPSVSYVGGIAVNGEGTQNPLTPANFMTGNALYVGRFEPANGAKYIFGTGISDFTFNLNHALGLATSSARTGSIFDAGLAGTSTVTSSIILPAGTTAQRPTTGINGMVRYNSSTSGVEAYNGSWNPIGGTWVSSITPGAGLASTITGSAAAITTTGTLYGNASYFAGAKGGLGLSNDATTPNTVIDIAAGSATDDTNTVMMKIAAFTKTTGAWTLGSGNGCLDTGSVANSTWYHTFLIERPDTGVTDILCSTSMSPTFPANYTVKRDIGPFQTDGSANIVPFKQVGNDFYRTNASALEFTTTNLGTNAVFQTLPDVPPGVSVSPIYRFTNGTAGNSVILSAPFEPDELPTTTYPTVAAPGFDALTVTTTAGAVETAGPRIRTNTNQQIRLRSSGTGTATSFVLRGFTYDFSPISSSAQTCSYQPPLDEVTDPVAVAYSFRVLKNNWIGKNIVTIKRSSDNTSKTFTATAPTCTIDQTDAFFDGSTYTATTWFDQSGNGRNASNTGQFPNVLLNCQNSKPCLAFNAPNTNNLNVTLASAVGADTFAAVASVTTGGTRNMAQISFDNNNNTELFYNGSNCASQRTISNVAHAGTKACSTATFYRWIGTNNATLSSIYINGAIGTDDTSSQTIQASTFMKIGQDRQNTNYFTGDISELIVFSPDISITNSNTLSLNQGSFWGIP